MVRNLGGSNDIGWEAWCGKLHYQKLITAAPCYQMDSLIMTIVFANCVVEL